jgi:hypothetical protein
MAIIVDPDNLDRAQVIFGTDQQIVSLLDVGTLITADTTGSNGESDGGNNIFFNSGSNFITDGVTAGDVLCVFTTSSAGHYYISTVDSAEQLTVLSDYDNFSRFVSATFEVREPTGGTIVDGVTLQAIYSYAKEEWKTDTAVYGGDDLIRHEFPYEAITSEQFEIGGGQSHADWAWFDPSSTTLYSELTKKFVRTGGWEDKNTAGTSLNQWTGIITLGALDADTQVYFQQLSASADPQDFKFTGPVNEALFISQSTPTFDDRTTFLKLFARKKARTYAQSAIADIGVSTIRTIVNRFPLAHVVDPAIVARDAAISGSAPWRETYSLQNGTGNGSTADIAATGLGAFTGSAATFQTNGVLSGDTLFISGAGSDAGYWSIDSVDSETTLTINTLENGPFTGDTGLDFSAVTTDRVRFRTDDGAVTFVNENTSILTSSVGGFTAAGVGVDDILIISEGTDDIVGAYEITAVDSDTQVTINTFDNPMPAVEQNNADYRIVLPGMYLQYKQLDKSLGATGNITFEDTNPDRIFRETGDWVTDGFTSGSVIEVAGSTSNNGEFTVASFATVSSSNDTAILVATDTLTAESASAATITGYDGHRRQIQNVYYSFHWKVFGNDSTLGNIYEFIQHELRQPTDIDYSKSGSRGDVTDLLMSFATPTATMFDCYIEGLDATDTNNVTFRDATGADRVFAFVSVGSISFNINLQQDAAAEYWMYFTNDDAGDNTGRDFSTPNAIIVQDENGNDISGSVGAASSIQFTFDYDNNTQRGGGSSGTDAPITVVAIGLDTAQYVITTATIEKSKANNVSLVAALERNYSNPS